MTDRERINDAYDRVDIETDNILAFCDGEEIERSVKSIWDSTVTMHEIATVALKENAKLRWLVGRWYPHMRKRVGDDALRQWGHMDIVREVGIEVKDD